MIVLALSLAYAGLMALCLAMSPHQRQVLGRELAPVASRALRAGGALLLLASLVASIAARGAQTGVVDWVAGMAVVGFSLVLMLAFRPRLCLHLAWFAPALSLVALAIVR